eukprot:gene5195-6467_t
MENFDQHQQLHLQQQQQQIHQNYQYHYQQHQQQQQPQYYTHSHHQHHYPYHQHQTQQPQYQQSTTPISPIIDHNSSNNTYDDQFLSSSPIDSPTTNYERESNQESEDIEEYLSNSDDEEKSESTAPSLSPPCVTSTVSQSPVPFNTATFAPATPTSGQPPVYVYSHTYPTTGYYASSSHQHHGVATYPTSAAPSDQINGLSRINNYPQYYHLLSSAPGASFQQNYFHIPSPTSYPIPYYPAMPISPTSASIPKPLTAVMGGNHTYPGYQHQQSPQPNYSISSPSPTQSVPSSPTLSSTHSTPHQSHYNHHHNNQTIPPSPRKRPFVEQLNISTPSTPTTSSTLSSPRVVVNKLSESLDSQIDNQFTKFFNNKKQQQPQPSTPRGGDNTPSSTAIASIPLSSPLESNIFVQISDLQEKLYRNLLKDNIPKMHSKDIDQTNFLQGLYLMLMKCCNHPYLFPGVEPTPIQNGYHLIQNSGKLVILEKLIDSIFNRESSTGQTRVIILTYSQSMINIIVDFCKLKSLSFGVNNEEFKNQQQQQSSEDPNSPSFNYSSPPQSSNHCNVLISTFQNFSSDQLFENDIVIEFDHYWKLEPYFLNKPSHSEKNLVYRFITSGTVEEWVFIQNQKDNGSDNCINPENKKELMIEMMKFCIVSMAKKSNNTTAPSTPTSSNNNNNTNTPSTPTSTTPTTPSTKTTPSPSPLNTSTSSTSSSISFLSSSNSSVNHLMISPSNPFLESQSQSSPNLWKLGSPRNGVFPLLPSNSSDQLSMIKAEEKKKVRSPKKHRILGDRSCFTCKKEEDSKGRTSIVQCRSCPKIYHRSCAGLSHTPRSWKCGRHSCRTCRKTPNESGGSFFICKGCPSSYCITCLPDQVKILDKGEYFEVKQHEIINHDSTTTITTSCGSIPSTTTTTTTPIQQSQSQSCDSLFKPVKKQKVQRPTVFILCEVCSVQEANSPSTNNSTTTSTTSTSTSTTPSASSISSPLPSSPSQLSSPPQPRSTTPSQLLPPPPPTTSTNTCQEKTSSSSLSSAAGSSHDNNLLEVDSILVDSPGFYL